MANIKKGSTGDVVGPIPSGMETKDLGGKKPILVPPTLSTNTSVAFSCGDADGD